MVLHIVVPMATMVHVISAVCNEHLFNTSDIISRSKQWSGNRAVVLHIVVPMPTVAHLVAAVRTDLTPIQHTRLAMARRKLRVDT